MTKWVLAAATALGLAGSANGAVITLEGVASNGQNDFTFSYQGTLGPDEGLRSGDRLVIFDFQGYINGSIFSAFSTVTTSVENVSTDTLLQSGQNDDANIANLVFTYNGPDLRNEGGPFESIDFDGIGARSTFGGTAIDAFYTRTTKNNPDATENTRLDMLGLVQVPGAVPEPTTWAMMIGGFALAGAAMRRRNRMVSVSA